MVNLFNEFIGMNNISCGLRDDQATRPIVKLFKVVAAEDLIVKNGRFVVLMDAYLSFFCHKQVCFCKV